MKKFLNAIKLLLMDKTYRRTFFCSLGQKLLSPIKNQIEKIKERKRLEKKEQERIKKQNLLNDIFRNYTEMAVIVLQYLEVAYPDISKRPKIDENSLSVFELNAKFNQNLNLMLSSIEELSPLLSSSESSEKLFKIKEHIEGKQITDFCSIKEIETFTLDGYSYHKDLTSTEKG